ncbi:muscarinic acetylcholine receptor M5-like [Mytilus galloprovincialis]|uniref:muscarinic acetylcholine receptor M5-like n=1 Tax=Mytilus galloprovincialis TaxID=29158 RepID=UPI003F7BDDB4
MDHDSNTTMEIIQYYPGGEHGIVQLLNKNSTKVYKRLSDENEQNQRNWEFWLTAVPLVALVITTIIANGGILVIFLRNRCIRRCRNIYILSLACADLLLGLTMPFSILQTLNREWTLSQGLCWTYLMIRYALYFVVLLSMILLTVDRWWSIHFPISYRVKQSRKIACILVACCWMSSLVLHIPLAICWQSLYGDITPEKLCNIPTQHSLVINVSASVLEYVLPMVVLISLNIGIYLKLLRRRNNTKIRRSLSTTETYMFETRRKSSNDSNQSTSNPNSEDDVSPLPPRREFRNVRRQTIVYQGNRRSTLTGKKMMRQGMLLGAKGRSASMDTATLITGFKLRQMQGFKNSFPTRKQSDEVVKGYLLRQDKKAVLCVGLLTFIAFICWTPYFITISIDTFTSIELSQTVKQIVYWILAMNAAINPFLYGFCNQDFRKVLKTWTTCSKYEQYKIQEALIYCKLLHNCEMEVQKDFTSQ